jgi:hypothetical protein
MCGGLTELGRVRGVVESRSRIFDVVLPSCSLKRLWAELAFALAWTFGVSAEGETFLRPDALLKTLPFLTSSSCESCYCTILSLENDLSKSIYRKLY